MPLQADEDPAVRLGHRRPGHRQHRGQRDRRGRRTRSTSSGARRQRRGRGRDQLAQGDPLGLVGQALERAGHEDVADLLPLRRYASCDRPGVFRRLLTARQPRPSARNRARDGVAPASAASPNSAQTLWPRPSRSTPQRVGQRRDDRAARGRRRLGAGGRIARAPRGRRRRRSPGPRSRRRRTGPQPPGHPDHAAGQRLGVPDGVADQLGRDGDHVGEQRGPARRRPARRRAGAGPAARRGRGAAPPRTRPARQQPSTPLTTSPTAHHRGQPRGSRTSATVPPPSRGRSDTHPFCRSTILRTR